MSLPTIEPGDRIQGFCGGVFGRDSYGMKTIVAMGRDWVVARNPSGAVEFAACSPSDLIPYLVTAEDEQP